MRRMSSGGGGSQAEPFFLLVFSLGVQLFFLC
jgi:hypothetical protein